MDHPRSELLQPRGPTHSKAPPSLGIHQIPVFPDVMAGKPLPHCQRSPLRARRWKDGIEAFLGNTSIPPEPSENQDALPAFPEFQQPGSDVNTLLLF